MSTEHEEQAFDGPVEATETALNFECQIVGLRLVSDGMRLTVQLHPQEGCVTALCEIGLNRRLMVSAVAIGDNEDLAPPPSVLEGVRSVRKAGILARDTDFQQFAEANNYLELRESPKENEEAAKLFLRAWCRVKSRSDLKYDRQAQSRLEELIADFNAWRRNRYATPPAFAAGAEDELSL
jgi:hypothetical protein